MVVIDLVLAVVVLPLLAIDALGIWIAYVVLFVASSLDLLFTPGRGGASPQPARERGRRPGHRKRPERHEQPPGAAVGPAAGGIIVATGGLAAVTVIDAVSFLVAAALIATIRTTHARAARHNTLEHEAVDAWRRLMGEWRDGLRTVVHHRSCGRCSPSSSSPASAKD